MGKILVYGMGISGEGSIKLLKQLKCDIAMYCDGYCTDTEGVENRCDYRTIEAILENIDKVILSPSIPMWSPVVKLAHKRGIPIIPEIQLAADNCLADIVAITGTNGKTTTVELMSALLKTAGINNYKLGNYGESFAEHALDLTLSDVAVVEVSSFQLEAVKKFKPKFAVCLNVTEDHIERHKTMAEYINAKSKIFDSQTLADYSILNYDDENVLGMSDKVQGETFYFSRKAVVRGAYLCGGNIYFKRQTPELVCSLSDIRMEGEHNVENVLACIVVAKILNLPNSAIIATLNDFLPPRHRVEYVGVLNGVRYYNDSKSTNCSSTLVAAKSMVGRTCLILGGYDKGLSYKSLFDYLPLKIACVICYGANREKIINEAMLVSSITVVEATSLKEAVELAQHVKIRNVLFSPGTSSYDSFKNYEERGNYFVGLVKGLISEK